jgi:hypothetical protein
MTSKRRLTRQYSEAFVSFCLHKQRFHPFMSDQSSGIHKTGLNILWLQPRVAFEDGFNAVASRKHAQNMLNRKPPPPDDRLPTEYFGVDRDPIQESIFVHHFVSLSAALANRRSARPSRKRIPCSFMLDHFGMASIPFLKSASGFHTQILKKGQGKVRQWGEFHRTHPFAT